MGNFDNKIGVSNDANLLRLVVKTVEIESVHKPYDRSGIGVQVSGYTLEDLINDLIEDYGVEGLIKRINRQNN